MKAIMTNGEKKAYSNHLVQAILFSKGVVDKAQETIKLSDREQEVFLGKVMELTAQDRYYYLQEHADELHDEQVENTMLQGTKIERLSKETPTERAQEKPQETQESKEEETEEEQPEEEEETTSNGGQMTLEDKLKAKLSGGD